jgi:hypothetical protein
MSFLKDYHDQHLTMIKKYWWKELINPLNLYHTWQHRYQRAERGWSDRDVWNAGDHIIDVISGMVDQLGDEKSHIDWTEYFKENYKKNHGYNSLNEVAADIKSFIEHDQSTWTDDLGFELKIAWEPVEKGSRMVEKNTPEEQRIMKKAMKEWQAEWNRRRAKMRNALVFVADNIPGLWD